MNNKETIEFDLIVNPGNIDKENYDNSRINKEKKPVSEYESVCADVPLNDL